MSFALAVVCASLIACDHGAPWAPEAVPPTPVRSGEPRRITFNPEGDHWPKWLPDGSGIGYSYHPLERTDRDRCLAFIPGDGGRITRQICRRGLRDTDSMNAVTTHGVSAGGRVALVAEAGNPGILFPDFRDLWLGRLDSGGVRKVMGFPYLTSAGQIHLGAADLTWPDESTLVYLATYISYRPRIVDIPPDTEYTGIELVRLDLRGDSVAARSVIPGTRGATSLSGGASDTVYYTMNGDTRVFWLATASGQSGTLYDFGSLGIARDAQVAGGVLAAVVGGRVRAYFRPSWGIDAQADSGGPVYTVHLPAGTPRLLVEIQDTPMPGSFTYRHLALDPSGRRVVAEKTELAVRQLREFTDTVVTKRSDLWLFEVP